MTLDKFFQRDPLILITATTFQLESAGMTPDAATLEAAIVQLPSMVCELGSSADFKEQMQRAMNPNCEPAAPQTPPPRQPIKGGSDGQPNGDDPFDWPIAAE